AHGRLNMAVFLDRHGYHGPNEGQLDSPSWREDPSVLTPRLEDLRDMGEDSSRAPRYRSAAQQAERVRAQDELAARLSPPQRLILRQLVRLAARFIALREQGKAGYLITFDVARAAARKIRAGLVEQGVLNQEGDIFFLTYHDVLTQPPPDAREL